MSNAIVKADRFQIVNGKPMTTTKAVAQVFEKLHKNVIRDVESLQVPDTWYKLNFEPIQIVTDLGHGRTRKDKAYQMTKDGFVFLAMGFTGKKAAGFKIAYIEAFNKMEEQLRNNSYALPPVTALTYNGQKVIPSSFLSYLLDLAETSLNYRKRNSGKSFIEGKHYFNVEGKDFEQIQQDASGVMYFSPSATKLTLWTEQGIREHLKRTRNNHIVHKVRNFLNCYFAEHEEIKDDKNEILETLNFPDEVSAVNLKNADKWQNETSIKKILDALESIGCDMTQPRSELYLYFGMIKSIQERLDRLYSSLPDLRNLKVTSIGKTGYKTEITA